MKIRTIIFRWLLLVGLIFSIFGGTHTTQAQENVTFESIQIDLWPEYDRPEVLVLYRIRLAASVQLPAQLNIQIPAAAGAPNAVAEAASGGPLLNVNYTSEIQGDWNVLQFSATQRDVQIEYYDPSIQIDEENRSYRYQWPGGYDIGEVLLLIQQPIGAEEMQVLPRINEIIVGERGIVYYRGELGSFSASESFERSIVYKKDSASLSIEFLEIDSPPVNEDTVGRVSLVNIIPWGIGLLGVIVIVAGVYWYWATENRVVPISKMRKAAPKPQNSERIQEKPHGDSYCHQCGKRAEGSDKFCRACGTKLRA